MAENLATALFQASPDCVEILDPAGLMTDMNPRGRALRGLDDFSRVRGRPWISLWPEEMRDRISATLEDARAGRAGFFEATCPTAEGTAKHWEVSILPIRDGAGTVGRILAASRDVTEAKAREAALKRRLDEQQAALVSLIGQLDAERRRAETSRARILHTEKLRILGRFVGSVVHDINNVLASMSGAARLLRRRAEDARTLDILDHVDLAVERGVTLVRRLLDFSRSGEGAAEPLDVAAAIATDAELLRHLVGRTVSLSVEVEDGLWPVSIAPGRLQSVLFNLVANARDAIGAQSGRIRVAARNRASTAQADGPAEGDRVEISVEDDGPGMPPEVIARLGEPFFTTKEAGKGTGLGVPSAFDLAEQVGGRIEIDSSLGRGTRISLHLPRASADGKPVERPDADVDPSLHGEATVLLVEGEANLRHHLATLLRGLRYAVIEAPDAATAAAVFTAGLAVDILVGDLDPDGSSVVDLARMGRRDRPELPALFVSDAPDLSGPVDEVVLRKPIDERRFVRALLEQLGRIPASRLTREALCGSDRARDRIRDPRMRDLFDGWRAAADVTGRLPSMASLRERARDLADRLYLVEVGGDVDLPRLTVLDAGSALRERFGRDPVRRHDAPPDVDVPAPSRRPVRRIARGVAWFDDGRAVGVGGSVAFERLLLPLSDDGERVTHLLGVVLFEGVPD